MELAIGVRNVVGDITPMAMEEQTCSNILIFYIKVKMQIL